jgi:hypothetical protein
MRSGVLILLLSGLVLGCSRGKYFSSAIFNHRPSPALEFLELDSTYRFYLREVYKDKNKLRENVLVSNPGPGDTASKVRIEVEYLLLSFVHKNAVYVSTIPDKFQSYYSKYHLPGNLLNAYDFSTFHFGKIDPQGESISFVSKDSKRIVTWDIRPFVNNNYPRQLFIREIAVQQKEVLENVILLNKALEGPVEFIRQPGFRIIFYNPRSEAAREGCPPAELLDRRIYFQSNNHSFNLFFHFDRNVGDSRDSAIGFDYRRTRYSPAKLEQKRMVTVQVPVF